MNFKREKAFDYFKLKFGQAVRSNSVDRFSPMTSSLNNDISNIRCNYLFSNQSNVCDYVFNSKLRISLDSEVRNCVGYSVKTQESVLNLAHQRNNFRE